MPRRRPPGACSRRLPAHHRQDPDRGIVVVDHVTLGRLSSHLIEDRLGVLGLGRNNVPLRRGGQGNADVLLERFVAVERHAHPVFQQSDHAPHRGVALSLGIHPCWQICGDDHAAQAAAQLLQIIHLAAHRRLAHQSHHHAGATGVVERALCALWAGIARLERRVGDLDLFRGGVGIGSVVAVTLGSNGLCRLGIDLDLGSGGRRLRWPATCLAREASLAGDAAIAGPGALSAGRCPTTFAVFSVFIPKSIFRSRAMVVFLSPTAKNRPT